MHTITDRGIRVQISSQKLKKKYNFSGWLVEYKR